jgi:hypothetical protein
MIKCKHLWKKVYEKKLENKLTHIFKCNKCLKVLNYKQERKEERGL